MGEIAGDLGQMVIEPFAPRAHPRDRSLPYLERTRGDLQYLLGRWSGHNEEVTSEMSYDLHWLFNQFTEARPTAIGFKTLLMPYWDVVNEHWPGTKFVRLSRGLQGYLCCIARKPKRLSWFLEPWYYPLEEDPPWYAHANSIGVPEKWLPLVRAAYMRSELEDWRDAREPAGAMHITFEDLTCDWDYAWPRLLEFCDLPVPRPDRLREIATPVERSWAKSQYTRAEIAHIMSFLEERGDCRVD